MDCDSTNYDVLQRAAEGVKDVPGLILEIGTRAGGSLKYIIDGLFAASDLKRTIISVDPYGQIPYIGSDASILSGGYNNNYTNDMKLEMMRDVCDYVLNIQKLNMHCKYNIIFYNMLDSQYMEYFKDGVPVFDDSEGHIINQYALVFFDGPHSTQSVLDEIIWCNDRSRSGTTFCFDDVNKEYYNHKKITDRLIELGYRHIETINAKETWKKP